MHKCNRCKKQESAKNGTLPFKWSIVAVVIGDALVSLKLCKSCTYELQRFTNNEPVQLAT